MGEIFDELIVVLQTCCSILSFSRDMHGTLDEDHGVIIEEHSSQLQKLISTKSGGLLDELVQREVITVNHKHDIMVSIKSGGLLDELVQRLLQLIIKMIPW